MTQGVRTEVLMLRSPSLGKELYLKLQVMSMHTPPETTSPLSPVPDCFNHIHTAWTSYMPMHPLACHAQGEGVNTALTLEPASGEVDFGHVVEGRTATQTITLKNGSPFALRYQIRALTRPHENFSHAPPFMVSELVCLYCCYINDGV
jgi:hypothetical protein